MTLEELEQVTISQCGIRIFHETDVYKIINTHLVIAKQIHTKLEQRIAELEAPKSCELCQEFREFSDDEKELHYEDGVCLHGMSCCYRVYKDFSCCNYEPKDTE